MYAKLPDTWPVNANTRRRVSLRKQRMVRRWQECRKRAPFMKF